MGLLNKIEEKFSSGSSKHANDKQNTTTSSSTQNSSFQHPIQSAATQSSHTTTGNATDSGLGSGVGTTGLSGTQGASSAGYGRDVSDVHSSNTDRLRNTHLSGSHPSSNVQSSSDRYDSHAAPTSNNDGRSGVVSSSNPAAYNSRTGHASTTNPSTYDSTGPTTSTTTSTSTHTSRNLPREPYDPYSSKGQHIAAAAGSHTGSGTYGSSGHGPTQLSQGRTDAQDHGSRSNEDPDVIRSRNGGISNGLNDQGLKSGPHPELENRAAVPIAGGQKLGSGAQTSSVNPSSNYSDSSPSGQHHHGRDAAVAATGGVGAAGLSSHEASKHGHHGHHGHQELDARNAAQSAYTSNAHPGATDGTHGQSGTTQQTYPQSSSTGQTHGLLGGTTQSHEQGGLRHPGQDISYMKRDGQDASQQTHQYGHHHVAEAGALGAGAGALGAGALSSGRDHHTQQGASTYNTHQNSHGLTGQSTTGGLSSDNSYPGSQSTGHQGLTGTTGHTSSGFSGDNSGYSGSQSTTGHHGLTGTAGNTASGLSSGSYSGQSSGHQGPTGANSNVSSGIGSTGTSELPGLTQAKKGAAAYEAGYRDALEHMKAERGN